MMISSWKLQIRDEQSDFSKTDFLMKLQILDFADGNI